ncbi:unnamed protein product [Ectocarpus sp. 6 AP-2014]
MTGWNNVAFMHLCLATYFSPPDLVCLILTSRDALETYGNAETYRAVCKSYFGLAGRRGHLTRRQRGKKGVWGAGDGAKARLSLLWQERTRNNVLQLQNAHLLQQREHERRWVLQQAAAVMRRCAYGSRQQGSGCAHTKLRLWTSANLVATKSSSRRSQERPPSHHGVRCDRCKKGPITGSCFRCAAGCAATAVPNDTSRCPPHGGKSGVASGVSRGVRRRQQQQQHEKPSPLSTILPRSSGEAPAREEREERTGGASGGGGGGCGFGNGFYTLCEACFPYRHQFHPPHPFARLRPGFAEPRLSGPVLYEAVCGDCSFGSLILVRPLKAREAAPGDTGSGIGGDLWAVPVRVDSAGPLPLSQARILHFTLLGARVKSRIAAGDRDDNRGLAFASDNWQLQQDGRGVALESLDFP